MDAYDELKTLGFFPTAYLPGLIKERHEPKAVVQFTRLCGRPTADAACALPELPWAEAQTLIDMVARLDDASMAQTTVASCAT